MDDLAFELGIKESFLEEASELLEQTENNFLELEKNPEDKSILEAIFRCAHNLKGSGKAVGFNKLAELAHQVENLLVELKDDSIEISSSIVDLLLYCCDTLRRNVEDLQKDIQAETDNSELIDRIQDVLNNKVEDTIGTTVDDDDSDGSDDDIIHNNSELLACMQKILDEEEVEEKVRKAEKVEDIKEKQVETVKTMDKKPEEFIRISLNKIDNLLNYFGEQVILQSVLEHAKHNIDGNRDIVVKTISQLSKITYDLQQTAIALRMLSIKSVFSKMERIVRDTSRSLGKKVEFVTSGENCELDKTIIESIVDPLVHMVRNAVDHGLELPEDRKQNGKSEVGKIWMNAYHKGGFFYLEVKDDGKGLDPEQIKNKAIAKGLVDPKQELNKNEIFDFIFASGFSTRESATDVSGRGVGMDVVKTAISKLKGTCELNSRLGEGTVFTIRLPLTLAIFNGMIVRIGSDNYIFPNSDIEETVTINMKDIRNIESSKIVNLRGKIIPVIDISTSLAKRTLKDGADLDKTIALITEHGEKKYALLVDELLSQQRIVHKKLGAEMKNMPGIIGGTILGDGKVALILETSSLIEHYQRVA